MLARALPPPEDKLVELSPEGEAGPPHSDVLLEPQVLNLVKDPDLLPVMRLLGFVGLYAPGINRYRFK